MGYQNILLIDDDEDDQEIFIAAVEDMPCKVSCISMSNASDALQKLGEKVLQPDVIFLDLNMPVMNGQQFLAAIKKDPDLKSIPVIIFSTTSRPSTIQLAKDLGASAFITKPGQYDKLVDILAPLLC